MRTGMDFNPGGEGPAILQLQKWGPSEFQLNLSEFREAFISPTRELLLLLSYQCEALLLPLAKGECINSKDPETYYESLQNPSCLTSCSPELAAPSSSDLRENISSTSESIKMVSDNDFSLEINFSRSNNYPFVCDVNSLAWGICGDTYNQHKEASFRELLFVSGNHGVTVHAFCQPNKTSGMTKPIQDSEIVGGMWVEWGPSTALAHNTEELEHSSLDYEVPGDVMDVNRTNGTGENLHSLCVEAGDDELSRSVSPKRFLRTFLTKVDTVKSDGKFWTKFPEKPSFPSSATVVSFNIFDSNSPLLDSMCHADFVSDKKESCNESVLDPANIIAAESDSSLSSVIVKPDAPSNFLSGGMSSSYKCSRVFSSNSHHLIGFVITLVDPVSVNNSDICEKNWSKILLLVARLDWRGIQWVCSVKLDESLGRGIVIEWTDFQFSDNFLICLNASGLIFFYGAITGEYIAHLDILQICGLHPQLSSPEQEKLFVEIDLASRSADIQNERDAGANGKSSQRISDLFGKRMFRRLLVASHTSLLAVIDEYGVIYVLRGGDHMPGKYWSFDKLLPHFQHLGLGILVGWEVGGAEISHQRVFSSLSGCHNSNMESIRNKSSSFMDDMGNNALPRNQESYLKEKGGQYDSYMSGFSAASQTMDQRFHGSQLPSRLMRKIFLPTSRSSEDDIICFSPFGVTRLIKKHDGKDNKSSQLVHSDLHFDSAVNDDRCFNLQGWEASVGEAVGCTFQGYLYLVTERGLSVVIPSVSVSSNFLPIEAIGYRQPSISTGIGCQVGNLLEMKTLKQHWSPWKVEVLDRVILYEGPEEADCLCLENGWELKNSRMRRLQLALDYLKFEEIENSLEMLVGVNLAEEGILRLLFAAVYLMNRKVGNDNEVSAASRLLALATCFATKMIRKYGLIQHKKDAFILRGIRGIQNSSLPSVLPEKEHDEMGNSRRLREMAHFLEIIRNLQSRLSAKFKRPGRGLVDGVGALWSGDTNLTQDDSELSIPSADALSLETSKQHELSIPASDLDFNNAENLALIPMDSSESKAHLDLDNVSGVSVLVSEGSVLGRKVFPFENPKDMIARWEIDNLDLKTVVKDALLSGRLPLAVVQLHLHQLRDLVTDNEPHDTFTEVHDVGRAIAYDLFLKGETGLAVATLQKLGEDIETSLTQLVFGTVRRSLRMQIAEEMKRYGYLGPYESKILESISLIERVYPCSSFWRMFHGRQKEFMRASSIDSQGQINLRVLHSNSFKNLIIECGEIDGVVLGSWANVSEHSVVPAVDEDSTHAGYWAAAAVWSDSWDQRTIDRVSHYFFSLNCATRKQYYVFCYPLQNRAECEGK
uniref:Spatacsin C-terminal domain-containing protein n=1 Tax=Davidia involucrata TaxID=16924 RepID=A0A5B6Z0A7_DAVIN